MNDTITAISTALGVGAISIIRLSGKDAISITNSIFKGKDLTKVNSHTINYGHIVDNDKVIDEVLVSVMKSPKTYTCEDIVEINCHGGVATTNKILELVLLNGARLAEPGEFTKRAFLNGRIDLVEAESVMDLIDAKTEEARKLSINQLEGKVSIIIRNFRQKLLELLASIEVNIDYPEYEDIEVITNENIKKEISTIKEELNKIIVESENGKIIKKGIKVAIVGRNNNEKITEDEKKLISELPEQSLIVINKNDLISNIDIDILKNKDVIYIDTISIDGIEPLKNKLIEMFKLEKINNSDYTYMSNARQISLAKEAYSIINDVEIGLKNEVPTDLIEIDIKRIWEKLGEILGESYSEELIDQLFTQFCLGK